MNKESGHTNCKQIIYGNLIVISYKIISAKQKMPGVKYLLFNPNRETRYVKRSHEKPSP